MQPIHQKALADITWADLEALISGAVTEGPHLEYKRTLAEPNGGDDAWIRGQDRIGRTARDELAREIVSFANAYGGLVLIGIEESQGSNGVPLALTPLPRCVDLAERLSRAISDIVDPPLPGFEVRAIPAPSSDTTGIVALRVSASGAAPHGYGEPPQTYVRRGSSATPMTMRDLQAVFWDARTRRERVDAIRSGFNEKLRSMQHQLLHDGFRATERTEMVPARSPGLLVGMHVIPQQSLELSALEAKANWLVDLCPGAGDLSASQVPAFDEAGRFYGWTPRAHGVTSEQVGPAVWTVSDDGAVSMLGFNQARENAHYPAWYAVTAAILITMGERLRRRSGRPDIPLEFSCSFLHDGSVRTMTDRPHARFPPPLKDIVVGPYIIAQQSILPAVFSSIEKQIWAAFSVPFVMSAGISFDRALEPGQWSQ